MNNFWVVPEDLQKAVWRASEDTKDNVWDAADVRVMPRPSEDEILMTYKEFYKMGKEHTSNNTLWGIDTGAEYIALFSMTKPNLRALLIAVGVDMSSIEDYTSDNGEKQCLGLNG